MSAIPALGGAFKDGASVRYYSRYFSRWQAAGLPKPRRGLSYTSVDGRISHSAHPGFFARYCWWQYAR